MHYYLQEHVRQVIIDPEMGHFYFGRTGFEIWGKLTYSCKKGTSFFKNARDMGFQPFHTCIFKIPYKLIGLTKFLVLLI